MSRSEQRLKRDEVRFAIRRDRLGRRMADMREAAWAVRCVGLGRVPDFKREREYRWVDEYFERVLGVIVDGQVSVGSTRLTDLGCQALAAAGYRSARRNKKGVWTRTARRRARALMKDPRTAEALRDKFEEVGLTGRVIANKLRTIIESEDHEAALKAIDIAIKVTGDYAPTRVDQRNLNLGVKANIFDSGTAFMDRVGKPTTTALGPAPETFEGEFADVRTSRAQLQADS